MKIVWTPIPGMDGEWATPEVRHDCTKAKRANDHLLHKLEKHGIDAQGVVTEMTAYYETDYTGAASYIDLHSIRVRVRLPDGSTSEFATVVESPDTRVDPVAGTILSVRYDPEDPSRIAVDAEKLWADMWVRLNALNADSDSEKAQQQRVKDAQNQAAVAAAEAKLRGQGQ